MERGIEPGVGGVSGHGTGEERYGHLVSVLYVGGRPPLYICTLHVIFFAPRNSWHDNYLILDQRPQTAEQPPQGKKEHNRWSPPLRQLVCRHRWLAEASTSGTEWGRWGGIRNMGVW